MPRFSRISAGVLFLLCSGWISAQTKVPTPSAPAAKAEVPTSLVLKKGQFYIVGSAVPLIILQHGDGKIAFTERDGAAKPLVVPADWAVGYKPDAVDPDLGLSTVTFRDKFLYIGKPESGGKVDVTLIPTKKVILVDKEGKESLGPITRADILNRLVDVDVQGPRPPPEVDPKVDPKVDPVVPEPKDVPLSAGDGKMRVLIVYNSLDPKMTPSDREILFGADVRDYLAKNAAKDGFRIFPLKTIESDPRFSNEDKIWKDAVARKRDSLPWLIVSNGKTFYEGKLPAGEKAFFAEADKHK
jgi:hypothetical protein